MFQMNIFIYGVWKIYENEAELVNSMIRNYKSIVWTATICSPVQSMQNPEIVRHNTFYFKSYYLPNICKFLIIQAHQIHALND